MDLGKLVITLDKEEFRIKLEQINRLVEKNDYKGAMEVVDSIDWRRVKNVRTLCVVGEIYAANKRYEDSKEIFLLAYHRAPIGKNILYRLIEVSLKTGNVEEAMEYYEEYLQVAPNDSTRYLLKYKIYKENHASLDELIQILEDYKEKEFTEKWSYELAKLYYKAGRTEDCLGICNEMVLWFSEGKYVMKAMDLKMKLSGDGSGVRLEDPEAVIDDLSEENTSEDEKELTFEDSKNQQPSLENEDTEEASGLIGSISTREEDVNYSESLQERISKGIRDIFNNKKRELDEVAEEEEDDGEEVHEEMLKDAAEEQNLGDVPELEEEDGSVKQIKSVEKTVDESLKMPELKIPKNIQMEDALKVPEIPKVANVGLVDPVVLDEEQKDFSFNLEDTILAAATAQGIEIPKEDVTAEKKSTPSEEAMEEVNEIADFSALDEEEFEEEIASEEPDEEEDIDSEDVLEEEDAEDEAFFEEEVKEESEAYEEEDSQDEELSEEEEFDSEFDEEEELDGEDLEEDSEEEYMSEEDLAEAEDEFLNGPSVRQKPASMDTDIFNFQEEIKRVLEVGDGQHSQEEDLEFISHPQPKEKTKEVKKSSGNKNKGEGMDLIPRMKALSEDEEKLFSYLAKIPGMEVQIVDALCDVQMAAADKTSRTGNVIVMGGRETGKTRLISGLIPAICSELHLEAAKVAYVFADQINGKNIAEIVNKLSSGFLVIEDANQLDKETVEQLNKAMDFRTDGLTVILEDEKIGMRKLLARHPKFAKKFTSMISIPVFTNDELVNFAKVYTRENGYTIDQMGMLALYNQISSNQKADEPMSIGVVKELLDAAIEKSQGGIRKFKRNISKKRTDKDGLTVLYEQDFN